jgi:ubiquinone/menaquinone biosynthesis C-methylase UbiE
MPPICWEEKMIPSRKLIDGVGGGDFTAVGREFFHHFTEIGGLQPEHRVLDVGYGCGRMAVPLISFLSGTGEYHGFDIVPDAIKWSQKHITRNNSRFHFELADICNSHYNNEGKILSDEYRFAYPDNFFDFTFLTSVFTHMFAADMEHYLSEIARTLKPGGKCMINFFLLNPEAKKLMEQGASSIQFKHALIDCVTSHKEKPEAAIAFEESFVRQCIEKYQLTLAELIHFGGWSGRETHLSYQDIVLAVEAAKS